MRLIAALLFLSLGSVATSRDLGESDAEQIAVLAVVENLYAAIDSRDAGEWIPLFTRDGKIVSFRQDPDREPGQQVMRVVPFNAMLDGMENDGSEVRERWIGKPIVNVRGSLATAWGDYDISINSTRLHCGITALDFVKVDGKWLITHWMYTVEPDGCSPDPS